MIVNHIALLLDSSSSMDHLAAGVIQAYNQQAQQITDKSNESGQKTLLSLYTFASVANQPVLVECPLDLVQLKPLDSRTYKPYGNTAMLDSIGMAVDQLSRFERGKDDSFLVICITDGEENCSVKYPSGHLMRGPGWGMMSEIIKQKSNTDRWTFAFLVPEGSKQSLIQKLNVYEGNVLEWNQTAKGVENYNRAMNAGIGQFFQDRQSGKKSTRGFFQTDLSKTSRGDVVRTMVPVTDMFHRLSVDKETVIRPFVEYHLNCTYNLGNAYYELTKTEKIQAQKKIVVEDLKTGSLYSGPEGRHLLGFPDGLEIKVKPGNHGGFKVYVQSTSVNRKLMPGTTLLYYKGTGVSV